MKEFFLILFFAKTISLTPEPVDLIGEMELQPKEPLKAITSGASIQIDVSSTITWGGDEGIVELRQRLAKMFPANSIKAKLIGNSNQEVVFTYKGNHLFNRDSVTLSLYSDNGVPTDMEFRRVIITSNIELKGVYIFWKNHKH